MPMIDRLIHSATCLSRPPSLHRIIRRRSGSMDGRMDGVSSNNNTAPHPLFTERSPPRPRPAQRHLAENGKCEMRQEMAMCLWAATTHFSCAADAAAARKNSMGDMEGGREGAQFCFALRQRGGGGEREDEGRRWAVRRGRTDQRATPKHYSNATTSPARRSRGRRKEEADRLRQASHGRGRAGLRMTGCNLT